MHRSPPIRLALSSIRRRLSALLAAALTACDEPSEERERLREQCEQLFARDRLTHLSADITHVCMDVVCVE